MKPLQWKFSYFFITSLSVFCYLPLITSLHVYTKNGCFSAFVFIRVLSFTYHWSWTMSMFGLIVCKFSILHWTKTKFVEHSNEQNVLGSRWDVASQIVHTHTKKGHHSIWHFNGKTVCVFVSLVHVKWILLLQGWNTTVKRMIWAKKVLCQMYNNYTISKKNILRDKNNQNTTEYIIIVFEFARNLCEHNSNITTKNGK